MRVDEKTVAPESAGSQDGFMPFEPPPRAWTGRILESEWDTLFYDFSGQSLAEIDKAIRAIRLRGITLGIMKQEDFRIPSFARDVSELRARLDGGYGLVVLRGLDLSSYGRQECEMIYWGVGNYLGRVMRQNLRGERLDKVMNLGEENVTDPYRVIETDQYFQAHTDNAMLEPRPPHYLGLMCIRPAQQGGESLLVSAYTIHNAIRQEHPEYLPRLYQIFHIDPPIEQRLAGGPSTWTTPVFEWDGRDLTVHYIRYLMDPGMEVAETPLTAEERAMLDHIDSLLRREDLQFRYQLQPGEILFENNRRNLHGRTAFTDSRIGDQGRELRRIWLWRRHGTPGMDPVELDAAELKGG